MGMDELSGVGGFMETMATCVLYEEAVHNAQSFVAQLQQLRPLHELEDSAQFFHNNMKKEEFVHHVLQSAVALQNEPKLVMACLHACREAIVDQRVWAASKARALGHSTTVPNPEGALSPLTRGLGGGAGGPKTAYC